MENISGIDLNNEMSKIKECVIGTVNLKFSNLTCQCCTNGIHVYNRELNNIEGFNNVNDFIYNFLLNNESLNGKKVKITIEEI